MQIRTRLTLQFLLIGGVIMLVASVAIYLFSSGFRRDDFYNRLENKAISTARLLIEVDEIDADLLKKIEADNPVKLAEERIIILNYKNDTLYTSDEKGEIIIENSLTNSIRLQGEVKYKQDPYEVLGFLYTERYDRFVVIAAATDITGILQLKNLRWILLFVCLTSFLIFSAAGWMFAGRALQPISGVVEQVEDISISSLDLRLDEGNGTDEIARLSRTFNKMLERLEVAFKLQKDFISHASHELRTPLTSINGQLEVLLMKERPNEEYKSAVASVLEDIRNLTDLSNRLLLLAHTASEKQNSGHILKIRCDEILWQVKEELHKYNKEFKINISIGSSVSDSDQMVIKGDEYLIRTAFANLLENACKYSADHSVDVNVEYETECLLISFTDTGIGIPEEDLDQIFEPFHRGSNVNVPGHGIGLSLVSQILKNHNARIEITSSPGHGTTVQLRFPSK